MMKERSSPSLAGSAADVLVSADDDPVLLEVQKPVSPLLLISKLFVHMWRAISKF